MAEVELVVNSRPLTSRSDAIYVTEALTPNYFLIGARSNNTKVTNDSKVDVILKCR